MYISSIDWIDWNCYSVGCSGSLCAKCTSTCRPSATLLRSSYWSWSVWNATVPSFIRSSASRIWHRSDWGYVLFLNCGHVDFIVCASEIFVKCRQQRTTETTIKWQTNQISAPPSPIRHRHLRSCIYLKSVLFSAHLSCSTFTHSYALASQFKHMTISDRCSRSARRKWNRI